jgi:hypothetical protein
MQRSHSSVSYPPDNTNMQSIRQRIDLYFIPFANQVERIFFVLIAGLFISVVLAQFFIFSFPEHQELFNKAVQYEGVFREDHVESKATLQHQ